MDEGEYLWDLHAFVLTVEQDLQLYVTQVMFCRTYPFAIDNLGLMVRLLFSFFT